MLFINPIIHKHNRNGITSNGPFGETKVATRQTRAQIMQSDVCTMSTGVNHARAVGLCGL